MFSEGCSLLQSCSFAGASSCMEGVEKSRFKSGTSPVIAPGRDPHPLGSSKRLRDSTESLSFLKVPWGYLPPLLRTL